MAPLTKLQKMEQLKTLGVECSGDETHKDLDELLAIHAPKDPATSKSASDALEEGDGEPITITYQDPNKGLTDREFSYEVHGPTYRASAAQFRAKFGLKK